MPRTMSLHDRFHSTECSRANHPDPGGIWIPNERRPMNPAGVSGEQDGIAPAARAPVFRGNNELTLCVPDPAAAAKFHATVLGCRIGRTDEDCVEVFSGALRLFLLRDPARGHDAVVPSFDVLERPSSIRLRRTQVSLLTARHTVVVMHMVERSRQISLN